MSLPPSIILEHHPDAQGMISTPFNFPLIVALKLKSSLQSPNSPLDLHLKHCRTAPKTIFIFKCHDVLLFFRLQFVIFKKINYGYSPQVKFNKNKINIFIDAIIFLSIVKT